MHGGYLNHAVFKNIYSRTLKIQKDYDAVSLVLCRPCNEGLGMIDAKYSSAAKGLCYQSPVIICELGRSID